MTITEQQKTAMREGRHNARRAREKDARAKVRAWRKWLAADCPKGSMPLVPSDSDFRIAGEKR